jgi:hypothetical protein
MINVYMICMVWGTEMSKGDLLPFDKLNITAELVKAQHVSIQQPGTANDSFDIVTSLSYMIQI